MAAMLSCAIFLTGCHTPAITHRGGVAETLATRNNCYSLLHQLLDEQKDVSILRYIKREHPDVKKLIIKIATTSGAGAQLLEEFAKQDSSILLDDFRLPPGELAVQDSIASTKQKELLSQSGEEFELTLLLTQTEALSYGWHLAKVAAENEPQAVRAQALAGVRADMENLYHEVFALLLSKNAGLQLKEQLINR